MFSGDDLVAFCDIIMSTPDDPGLQLLRTHYMITRLTEGAKPGVEALGRVLNWVSTRLRHGNEQASHMDPLTILDEASRGKHFRCVEYAIVTAAVARALGWPARILGLMIADVSTARSDAGHVAVEVWLEEYGRWAFVDGEFAMGPRTNHRLLNAWELRQAVARRDGQLGVACYADSRVGRLKPQDYIRWLEPYLFYIGFRRDQRLFLDDRERLPGKVILVPPGEDEPKMFQGVPIRDCMYMSDPAHFYTVPD
jgi:hypothetical protein